MPEGNSCGIGRTSLPYGCCVGIGGFGRNLEKSGAFGLIK